MNSTKRLAVSVAVGVALMTAGSARAEEPSARLAQPEVEKRANLLSFSPISIGVFSIAMEYERVLVPHLSLALGAHLGLLGTVGSKQQGAPELGGQLAVRWYPYETLRGFLVEAHGMAFRTPFSPSGGVPVAIGYGGGGMLAYTWLVLNRLHLGLGAGLDVLHAQALEGATSRVCSPQLCWFEKAGNIFNPYPPNEVEVRPSLRASIGVAF